MFDIIITDIVISINKSYQFSPAMFESSKTRLSDTLIILVYYNEPIIPCSILITDGPTLIGAAIIHKDGLEVSEGLRQDAVQTTAQIWFRIIDGNDYGCLRGIWHQLRAIKLLCLKYYMISHIAYPVPLYFFERKD